ncbi:MAG TPA: STAS domain-containing protein [Bacteroidales bacterium]|nr:STAS domain-containing protein [Bacteroidales bacterium]HRZ22001.1 STAS domain-containing protein [Bacteroidales bacterium]
MLAIQIQQLEKGTVITLEGQFNAIGAVDFDDQIAKVTPGEENVILDFSRVTFLSSAGVRSILKLEQSVRSAKGVLFIAGISDIVMQVLDISGLSRYLRIAGSLEEAWQMMARAGQAGLRFETENCTY